MIYIILFLIVLSQALEDGLRDRGLTTWSKRIEHFDRIPLMFILPVFYTLSVSDRSVSMAALYLFVIVVLYASIRAFLFDPVMHLVAGYPVNQVGSTSPVWDSITGRLRTWQFWVLRAAALGFSIFWFYKCVILF